MPRIAILATPRSGNTWLRWLLARALDCETLAVHRPGEIGWQRLPEDVVLQLHWPPTPGFTEGLEAAGARVVTLARHPLGVLVSILHFAGFEDATRRWLEGEGGDERALVGLSPASEEFVRYAVSPRADALLSVTPAWWRRSDVLRVRYEELAARPADVLAGLLEDLGSPAQGPLSQVVEDNRLERLRPRSHTQHFWMGDPDLWRRVLPPDCASRIAAHHAEVLQELGYRCDPDPELDALEATRRWLQLSMTASREQIALLAERLHALQSDRAPGRRQRLRRWLRARLRRP